VVERHPVDSPLRDAAEIPEKNVERVDGQLSVFEWYCPDCEEWLGWPENPSHAALVCADPVACAHIDEDEGACGHVVCGACDALADSHEWVLDGEQAGEMARQIFDDNDDDVEMEFRRALLEDLQQVTEGESVEEILAERQDLFEEYVETVDGDSDDTDE
jgi:hypothetical protein